MLWWEFYMQASITFFTHIIQSFSHKEGNAMKRILWVCLLVFGLILSWTLVYAGDFYVIPTKKKNYAPVEKTGQTTKYRNGDDGDLQKGVGWPNPRFKDNGNGTVTDNLTGLIWTQNADCPGLKTWANAVTFCNTLSSGICGLTDGSSPGDWRLPHVKELHSLIDFGAYNPALPSGRLFTNVHYSAYWSSTTYADDTSFAWRVSFGSGYVGYGNKSNSYYVLAVRGGN